MRYTITPIDLSNPITSAITGSDIGYAIEPFKTFLLEVTQRGLLIGTGSPLGVIEAQQGVEYMDETGAAGSVKWIKQLADVGGDKSLGWVAIG